MFLVPSVVSVSNICRWNVNVANSSEALRVTDDNDQDPKGISGARALVQRDTELMLGCHLGTHSPDPQMLRTGV